jgi:hypothetical protein
MYADVKELRPGAARKLQARLRRAAAAVTRPQSDNAYPSVPPRAYISPTPSSRLHQTGSRTPDYQHRVPGVFGSSPTAASGSRTTIVAGAAASPKYILLCVNTRRLRTLTHVDVATLTNDEYLFNAIRESYYLTRHHQEWRLSRVLGFLPSNRFSRYIGDITMLTPKSGDYVKVCFTQICSIHSFGLSVPVLTVPVSSGPSENVNLSVSP